MAFRHCPYRKYFRAGLERLISELETLLHGLHVCLKAMPASRLSGADCGWPAARLVGVAVAIEECLQGEEKKARPGRDEFLLNSILI